jgi:RNA polymerase-binding transcription factor DksA
MFKRFLAGLSRLVESVPAQSVTVCSECNEPIPAERRLHALRVGSESLYCSARCGARVRKRRQRERADRSEP